SRATPRLRGDRPVSSRTPSERDRCLRTYAASLPQRGIGAGAERGDPEGRTSARKLSGRSRISRCVAGATDAARTQGLCGPAQPIAGAGARALASQHAQGSGAGAALMDTRRVPGVPRVRATADPGEAAHVTAVTAHPRINAPRMR